MIGKTIKIGWAVKKADQNPWPLCKRFREPFAGFFLGYLSPLMGSELRSPCRSPILEGIKLHANCLLNSIEFRTKNMLHFVWVGNISRHRKTMNHQQKGVYGIRNLHIFADSKHSLIFFVNVYPHNTFLDLFDPKNPDHSQVANLRTGTPAMQVHPLPLEGPRILKEGDSTILHHHLGFALSFLKSQEGNPSTVSTDDFNCSMYCIAFFEDFNYQQLIVIHRHTYHLHSITPNISFRIGIWSFTIHVFMR